jgi:transcriptional regulator GlxA family with amidase domain
MDRRVQIIIAWMQGNLHREMLVDDLAEIVNLSASRLRHLFKDETRISLSHYLKELRMQRARHLLETTQLSIKQIRVSVGMQNKAHFTQDFKRLYGMTPKQYRHTLPIPALIEKQVSEK